MMTSRTVWSDKDGCLVEAEALDLCARLPAQSIDLVICDLPYAVTARNSWDKGIDLSAWWAAITRITQPDAAVVLTAKLPFSILLGASNLAALRYEWIAEKTKATGHLNAKKMPMQAHENVLVFCREGTPTYNAQLLLDPTLPAAHSTGRAAQGVAITSANWGEMRCVPDTLNAGVRQPRSVLPKTLWPSERAIRVHPTQKPLELWRYLISTYSNPGDVVFDPCGGSGTTAVAARKLNRRFIVGDSDPFWADEMARRLLATSDLDWATGARARYRLLRAKDAASAASLAVEPVAESD